MSYFKIIKDSILGYIPITLLEGKIIQIAAFQRLRSILQSGMTYQVYPAAHHSRFEHSLGTMHIAGMIIDRLLSSQGTDKAISNWLVKLKNMLFYLCGLWENRDLVRDEDIRQLVRIMALLHDVGHLPYSHSFEEAVENFTKFEEFERLPKTDTLFSISRPITDFIEEKEETQLETRLRKLLDPFIEIPIIPEEEKMPLHEQMGHCLLLYLFRKTIDKHIFYKGTTLLIVLILELKNLKEIPEITTKEKWADFYEAFNPLNEIISGGLDADRLDFVIRDSHTSGLRTGGFDLDRIIENVTIIPKDKESPSRFSINIKGLSSVIAFYNTYFETYRWLHYHHVVIILDKILSAISSYLMIKFSANIHESKKSKKNLFTQEEENFLVLFFKAIGGDTILKEVQTNSTKFNEDYTYSDAIEKIFSLKNEDFNYLFTEKLWESILRNFYSKNIASTYRIDEVYITSLNSLILSVLYRQNLPIALWRNWHEFKEHVIVPLLDDLEKLSIVPEEIIRDYLKKKPFQQLLEKENEKENEKTELKEEREETIIQNLNEVIAISILENWADDFSEEVYPKIFYNEISSYFSSKTNKINIENIFFIKKKSRHYVKESIMIRCDEDKTAPLEKLSSTIQGLMSHRRDYPLFYVYIQPVKEDRLDLKQDYRTKISDLIGNYIAKNAMKKFENKHFISRNGKNLGKKTGK